ncbi:hypothetical protein [Burkholderia cenocepacia]|uniref:hypothetical protein n=1 Tax=Burkholderia cenocepacia TaxID=95486 RepID=UPI002ABD7C4B|nr:hypothetical protein [Burkholderia cenocepacia]
MSAVIIVPTQEPSTVDHEFTATTVGGREMSIVVTAMREVSADVVLADVKASLAESVKVSVSDESGPSPWWYVAMVAVFTWLCVGLLFVAGYIIVDGAALLPDGTRWPELIPFAGGQTLGTGLVRVWLLTGPAIALAFVYVRLKEGSAR